MPVRCRRLDEVAPSHPEFNVAQMLRCGDVPQYGVALTEKIASPPTGPRSNIEAGGVGAGDRVLRSNTLQQIQPVSNGVRVEAFSACELFSVNCLVLHVAGSFHCFEERWCSCIPYVSLSAIMCRPEALPLELVALTRSHLCLCSSAHWQWRPRRV